MLRIPSLLQSLNQKADIIMAKVEDAAAELTALQTKVTELTDQVDRNRQEVLDKIATLEANVPAETTPEFDAALAALKTSVENLGVSVQAADDDVG